MRIRAVLFPLALGIATPAIGATSITDWSEKQFVIAMTELSMVTTTCKRFLDIDMLAVVCVMEVAEERMGGPLFTDANAQRYKGIGEEVKKASEKPATFCWIIEEKYGPEGTVLPGMVKAL